jgi:hypothetical protein
VKSRLWVAGIFCLALWLATVNQTSEGQAAPTGQGETGNIVVANSVVGKTTTYIGANEALSFYIDDLTDLGVNTYRLWTKMAELEWWDDDDAMDGLWDDSEYGTPTIVQIKADQASGFANTIPWSWWDARFQEIQSWRQGTQVREVIIQELVNNGITPVIVLRTIDDQGNPDYWPGVRWAPKPPVDQDFLNEWWEHCFAIAYWLNVRNNYGITHFEVLNEPDFSGQGWAEYGGTKGQYTPLVSMAWDAVKYANDLSGLPVYIHAPVVANASSLYVSYTLDNVDAAVDVVDYHTYLDDPTGIINTVQATIAAHNLDGVAEPIWITEWGTYQYTYNTVSRAMLTANQLMTFSEEEVEGITIFSMYDWGGITDSNTWFSGLIDVNVNGVPGKRISETYYAYRLMVRGLVGGKERLEFINSGLAAGTRVIVTRDDQHIYVIILRNSVGQTAAVTVDLSDLGISTGTASIWEYSDTNKDALVDNPVVAGGQFTFVAPANGISLARVQLPLWYFPIIFKNAGTGTP